MLINTRKLQPWLLLLTGLISPVLFSSSQPNDHHNYSSTILSTLKHGHSVFQLGNYWSQQGKQQHIDIQGLVGDEYLVTNNHSNNGLVGLGYFVDGNELNLFKMSYGINAFYLAKSSVTGEIVQENLFTNLSYHYNITHYPVYVVAKSTIPTKSPKYGLTIDAGIGPNFINTNGYTEGSLDGGVTIPDSFFSGHTSTTFSATAGLGIKLNHVFGEAPLECGYRFFYLGEGNFNARTNQLLNTLHTGNIYANAVSCSIVV